MTEEQRDARLRNFKPCVSAMKAGASPIGSITSTSGVDLTFATHPAASSQRECQILNSTGILYLLVVL
jgi:hypothetical protein